MITAVDTNVLLDLLIPDNPFASASEASLVRAQADGALIIGDIVFAELAASFPSPDRLTAFLGDVLSDFLVGGHAQILADRLLTRYLGYFRRYFPDLVVAEP